MSTNIHSLFAYLYTSAEILGMIFSILFVLLAIKESTWCWLFGAIGGVFYIFAYFQHKFYADMSLQFYYVVVSVYGWWNWTIGKKQDKNAHLPIVSVASKQWLPLIATTMGVFLVYVYLLYNFTDSPVIIGDSFVTAVCIIATWMAAKRMLENWLFFIMADVVSIGLYIYKGMYPTILLFVVYTIMAIIGYLQWKKDIKKEESSL